MIEYRLENMPERLSELLEQIDAFVAEEEFGGKTTFLVYSEEDIADILNELGAEFASKNTSDTGWENKWKEFINEGYLTDNIYFIFEPKSFDDERKTIYINPSLAFGTGTHATTQVAARLLEEVSIGRSVLDIGTGSGILAIAAAKSGATKVDAFDIDEAALPNCRENIRNNACENVISAWAGDIADIDKNNSYDVVCANIISSVLLDLNDDILRLAREYIVFSGILVQEYDEVIEKLAKNGFKPDKYLEIKEWCGVRLKKEVAD